MNIYVMMMSVGSVMTMSKTIKIKRRLYTIREDIDALLAEYFAVDAELKRLKAEILTLCAAMTDDEAITQGAFYKSKPILDREKATLLAIARNIPIPKIMVEDVDYLTLEERLIAAGVNVEEFQKAKNPYFTKPRRAPQ